MKIHYSPETHSLVILVDRTGVEAEEVAPGVVVDFDPEGRVVAIEFEDASGLETAELEIIGLPVRLLAASATGAES